MLRLHNHRLPKQFGRTGLQKQLKDTGFVDTTAANEEEETTVFVPKPTYETVLTLGNIWDEWIVELVQFKRKFGHVGVQKSCKGGLGKWMLRHRQG